MAGYLIANIDVKDPAKFEEYRQKVMPVIKKFGGSASSEINGLPGEARLRKPRLAFQG